MPGAAQQAAGVGFQVLCAVVLLCAHAQAGTTVTGNGKVIDGDTLDVFTTSATKVRVRLHGIDAPESAQTCLNKAGSVYQCGQVAKQALAAKLKAGASKASCAVQVVDKYGRSVAVCSVGTADVNAYLVASGFAVAYREYSLQYVAQEEAAKAAKLGLWAGSFTMPWDWRHQDQDPAPNPACAIKGNINSSGDKIYHLPGSELYNSTVINESLGERWFCNETQAQLAGWRPSGCFIKADRSTTNGDCAYYQPGEAGYESLVMDPAGGDRWYCTAAQAEAAYCRRLGCEIKGNINSAGAKIYHTPASTLYAATKIDKPGERWFCSEAEAQQAGWRPPK